MGGFVLLLPHAFHFFTSVENQPQDDNGIDYRDKAGRSFVVARQREGRHDSHLRWEFESYHHRRAPSLFICEVWSSAKAGLVRDETTGKPRGFGFVLMSDDLEAKAAILKLNFMRIDGSVIMVKDALPPDSWSGWKARSSRSALNTAGRHQGSS